MHTSTEKFSEKSLETIINTPTDYYNVLAVSKDSTLGEIRQAYKKLALVLHPDKNPSPKAEEAFKIVSKAYSVLCNSEARRQYDLLGTTHFEAIKFSKEPRLSRPQNSFLSFLPFLIILLCIVFLTFFGESNEYPDFRYTPSGEFTTERITKLQQIRYFVKPECEDWLDVQPNEKMRKYEGFIEFKYNQLSEIKLNPARVHTLWGDSYFRASQIQPISGNSPKLLTL